MVEQIMALGACRWFWVDSGGFSSSYGEIRCFKFKRSRQPWEVFAVSSTSSLKTNDQVFG